MPIVGAKEIQQYLTLLRNLLTDSSICFIFSALVQVVSGSSAEFRCRLCILEERGEKEFLCQP